MHIHHRPFTPYPQQGFSLVPLLRPFFQPFINFPIFRPFIQPFINHPFVRPWIWQQPQQPSRFKREVSADLPSVRSSVGGDRTLRANDPHLVNADRQSFDAEGAIHQLTRSRARWRDRNGDGKTHVAYTFNGGGFNEQQRHQARLTLQAWGDVANLHFTENGSREEGRMSFGISPWVSNAQGFGPDGGTRAGETLYNPGRVTRHDLIHETGHALGLDHPGDYNHSLNDAARIYAQDSLAHTVMSYYPANHAGKYVGWGRVTPDGPMMDDIAAIQRLYGVNKETRKGDTTYGFNSNSRRDFLSLDSHEDRAFFCVWDGAGNDTLDFSGYRANQVINLKAGSFSDVGGLKGNVSIARGCTLENAIGGTGHDVLIGNEVNNRLTGGGGGDQMRGGDGADTFVYNHASDSTPDNPDTLMDFTSGTDKIDVVGAMKNANTPTLTFTRTLSGKAGDCVIAYDETSGQGSVSIDLTGNGSADLLIKTHGQVKPEDILHAQNVRAALRRGYRPKPRWA